jgi:hypothetical protein
VLSAEAVEHARPAAARRQVRSVSTVDPWLAKIERLAYGIAVYLTY